MTLTKVTYSMIEGAVVNVLDFGADPTGTKDSTAAIQAAIDSKTKNYCVYFPEGKYTFTEVTISDKINLTVTGDGVLDGQITVNNVTVLRGTLSNLTLKGLNFNRGRTTAGKNAIVLTNIYGIQITGCSFKGVDKCISTGTLTTVQQVASVYITECTTGAPDQDLYTPAEINNPPYVYANTGYPNYFYYNNQSGNFYCGDINIRNNRYVFCSIGQIYSQATDGFYITDNVFQSQSYSYKSSIKTQNIFLSNVYYATIENNILYEAGFEAIYVDVTSNTLISNNTIAWCGQRHFAAGQAIILTPSGSDPVTTSIISNNTIRQPSGDGIYLGANLRFVSVNNNVIITPGSAGFYYGPPITGTHYGIKIPASGWQNSFSNNITMLAYNDIPKSADTIYGANELAGPFENDNIVVSGNGKNANSYTVGTITANSIDISGAAAVLLNTLGGTINAITGGNSGYATTIYVASNAVTFQASATVKLGSASSLVVPVGGNVTFMCKGGVWQLISSAL